jgi:RNA polymerase sigma factor (sigma-70 family)
MPPCPAWTARALLERIGARPAFLRARNLGAVSARAHDLAEEAVQEAHRRAHRPGQAFRSEEHYRSWLVLVAVNVVRDHFRQARRARRSGDPEATAARSTHPDRAEVLNWALSQLGPADRELLRSYYFDEQTYEDLARTHGRSITWVWQRIRQARAELRRLLESQDFLW